MAVAGELPDQLGAAVLEAAHEAFVNGMQLSSAIAAMVAVGLAVLALVVLRDRPASSFEADADAQLDTTPAACGGQLKAADG
ncbi:hypothetical protein BH20ACT7_BH20ACT7_08890 [soil metagenome]